MVFGGTNILQHVERNEGEGLHEWLVFYPSKSLGLHWSVFLCHCTLSPGIYTLRQEIYFHPLALKNINDAEESLSKHLKSIASQLLCSPL